MIPQQSFKLLSLSVNAFLLTNDLIDGVPLIVILEHVGIGPSTKATEPILKLKEDMVQNAPKLILHLLLLIKNNLNDVHKVGQTRNLTTREGTTIKMDILNTPAKGALDCITLEAFRHQARHETP